MKNYYHDILGVPLGADLEQIKKAFREKAKEFHPDKNSGDELMKKRFQLLSEAYNELKKTFTLTEEKENLKYSSQKKEALKQNDFYFKVKLRASEMRNGKSQTIYIKQNDSVSVVIQPNVFNGQILVYSRKRKIKNKTIEDVFHVTIEELAKTTVVENVLKNKHIFLIAITSLFVGFFVFQDFRIVKNTYATRAIILEKFSGTESDYIIYKNTEGNIFKIPNALRFWDCGEVGDSIVVSFTNYENPVFVNVEKIKQ